MGLVMKYFVLKPRSKTKDDGYARASQLAMLTYADEIEVSDPDLAREMRGWSCRELLRAENMGRPGNDQPKVDNIIDETLDSIVRDEREADR